MRHESTLRRLGEVLGLSGAFIVAGCGPVEAPRSAPPAQHAELTAEAPGESLFTLPRGGTSTLSLHSLPNASCQIRGAEAPVDSDGLRVFSDDDGLLRVHLQHIDTTIEDSHIRIDCRDELGAEASSLVHLQVADGALPQQPERYRTEGRPRLAGLDVDPASLTAEGIVARGYPPRPSAETAPAQYAQWLDFVSRSPTVIDARRVTEPRRTHGPVQHNGSGTSNNWSGYVITTPSGAAQYGEIFGAWKVPQADAEAGFWYLNHSTLWVGIDGWGTPDVVQAGTDQDTQTIFGFQASSYDAWTEWYPLSSQTISNFPVNPGDIIYTWVWVGTSTGAWSNTGNTGWFLVYNATQNVTTPYLSTAAQSGTTFNGHQAEWVMERPTVNGSLSSLADYSSAQIYDAWAYDFKDVTHYYTSDSSTNITMYNGGDELSSVAPVNSSTMQFTWHNYN